MGLIDSPASPMGCLGDSFAPPMAVICDSLISDRSYSASLGTTLC